MRFTPAPFDTPKHPNRTPESLTMQPSLVNYDVSSGRCMGRQPMRGLRFVSPGELGVFVENKVYGGAVIG